MTTPSNPAGSREFSFQCPHCQGVIGFSVDAYSSNDFDDDDDLEVWLDGDGFDFESPASRSYYDSMEKMNHAIVRTKYTEAVPLIRANLEHLTKFVESTVDQNDRVPPSIPVLEQGGRILALMGDSDGLRRMREIVTGTKGIEWFLDDINRHERDMEMFQSIRRAVRDNPKCLQSEVKILIGEADGRRVATLIGYLEKSGEITKIREGRKILLTAE